MGPDRPQDSFGLCFGPNGRFWTHFGPFSMIWARTDIVDPTWTSRTRPGTAPWSGLDPSPRLRNGPGMLLDQVSGQTVDSGVPAGDYMPCCCVGRHTFFSGKNRHAPKIDLFGVYCNSPNGYAHANSTAILCKGTWSIRKVTVPLSKPIAMRHHR